MLAGCYNLKREVVESFGGEPGRGAPFGEFQKNEQPSSSVIRPLIRSNCGSRLGHTGSKLRISKSRSRLLAPFFSAMLFLGEIRMPYSSPGYSDLVTTAAMTTTMPPRTVKIIPLQHPSFNAASSSSSSSYTNAVFSEWVTKLR